MNSLTPNQPFQAILNFIIALNTKLQRKMQIHNEQRTQ